MYREDRLHIRDLIDGTGSDAADRDSMDDTVRKAAESLNCGRDVYLSCDSQRLCSIAADKIREHEMHVSFHIDSLLNSM